MSTLTRDPRGFLDSTDGPLLDAVDVALLDLDGVVYRGAEAVEHAPEAITSAQARGLRTNYVTNNAARPPQTVADHLSELGIPTTAAEVTTAAQAAARLIASERPAGTTVLVVGGAGLIEAVEAEGLVPVRSAQDGAEVVVQGFHPSIGWADLCEAVYAVSAGADYVASNIDATLPTERGMAPGNGSLVAAVVNATGVTPRSTGKPQPEIFHQAAARAGATRPLVVGDRLNTDLAGARAADYPGLHVLTGVDGPVELIRAIPEQRPTLLAVDLRGLHEEHPAVVLDADGAARCRGAVASLIDGGIVVTQDGAALALTGPAAAGSIVELSLDGLRAACVLAWAGGVDTAEVADIRVTGA